MQHAERQDVVVVHGFACRIGVERGHLQIEDGVADEGRIRTFNRATARLRRLVILGGNGVITLEAIRWLHDVGAAYLQIHRDGQVLAAFGPQGTDRPALRRAQARALDTPTGDDIARRLIAEKVAAQAETLAMVDRSVSVSGRTVAAMRSAAAGVHLATNRDELRRAEAQAAAAYWSAWAPVAVRFARRDVDHVPVHWLTVGSRSSVLTGGPRLATNPANAILNYLYALLEVEATLAARIVGLDPGLGVLHADQLNRDSLAADLMEPVRPLVDQYVLLLLGARAFAAGDFYETRQGVCRVMPLLARELVATMPEWRQAVGLVAEAVARLLDGPRPTGRALPTPISGANRSGGRGAPTKPRLSTHNLRVPRRCVWCGSTVSAGRQTCSNDCKAAVAADNQPAFVAAGARNLAQWREEGGRAALTASGRMRIGTRAAETVQAARDWQRTHAWPADSAVFEGEILPRIAELPTRSLAEATGLSVGYCRQIKKGAVTPHPMWWEALRVVSAILEA